MISRPSRLFRLRLRRLLSRPGVIARAVSVLVLIVALALTFLAATLARHQERLEREAGFNHQVEQVSTLVSAQFSLYTSLVRAGQALFVGSDAVTRDDWRVFTETLGIGEGYSGVSSYTYVRFIPESQRESLIAAIRADDLPGFELDTPGVAEFYCPILYSEPAGTRPSVGYDVCRAGAPLRALIPAHTDAREIVITRRLTLVDAQTGIAHAGVVVFGPVADGWVAMPVRMDAMMAGILPAEMPVGLRMYSGAPGGENLLYAHRDSSPHDGPRRTVTLDLPGQSWTLDFSDARTTSESADGVLTAGIIISLLLWLLLWRAGAVHARAVALADQMTHALRESEAQRQRAEEFSLVMVTRIHLDGRWQSVPFTLGRLLGMHPSRLIGNHYKAVLAPEEHAAHQRECERLLRGEIRSFDMEQRFLHKDGHILWLYVNWSVVTDADGTPIQFLAYLRDISDSKRTELALKASEEKHRNIIESLEDAYFESDLAGNLTFFNDALVKMLGYPPDELMGMNNRAYMHPEDHAPVFDAFNHVYMTGASRRGLQWRVRSKDGESRFIETSIALMHNTAGEPIGFRGIARDVTERREADERIHHLAHFDSLTGLPNRTLFEDRVRQVLRRRWRSRERAALLFLDLDRFKTVNDSLGHHAGDMLLQAVATRISECVRAGDTVCRPGGDEFLVLLADLGEPADAAQVAAKILDAVSQPYALEGWEFSITPSIGIAVIPDDGNDIDTLVRHADAAMYHAKESGRNNFQFFTDEMTEDAAERLALEQGLRRALEREELELYYQPLVDVRDGRIVGAEALLRWNRPDHGVVGAGEFIGVVEQSGLILGIGEWVLAHACHQAYAWHEQRGKALPVSVNLSALQFRQHGLVETIAGALADAKLDPSCLELELTESLVMQDAALTIETVRQLRELGVHFAIDDFGTGYSSLSYLKRFPIDRVKIDQSFVRDLTENPDDTGLINAIISMGRSLRMEVLAEGVETPEQMAYLYKQDCFVMQGYLFSHPVPAAEFEKLLEKGVIHP